MYVVEYKPRVASDIKDTEPHHLSEVFLQAYYLQRQYCHPIFHVLTDLNDFHCFEIKQGQILKYHYTKTSLDEPQDLLKHSNSICDFIICGCTIKFAY